jgi:ABC-2 type transport system ATP-binding protein
VTAVVDPARSTVAAPTASPLVLAEGVAKTYGGVVAVDGLDLQVGPGELVGLLGPNGAGKTTLLQLVTGLRRPSAGRVQLFGGDPTDAASRQRLGTTPQETGLPPTLRVREVLDFVAQHYDEPMTRAEALERFELDGLADRQTGGLSGGQKRRLAVALAFVGRPRLVVLDEPTTGLDGDSRQRLWSAIRDYHADGGTVLLTSHYLEEVEALASRVVVVVAGRVVADGTVDEVRAHVGARELAFRVPLPWRPDELPGLATSVGDGDRWRLRATDADEVVRELVRRGVPFSQLEVRPASLEDAFLELVGADR